MRTFVGILILCLVDVFLAWHNLMLAIVFIAAWALIMGMFFNSSTTNRKA